MKKKKREKKRSKLQIAGEFALILIALVLLGTGLWMLYNELFPNNTPLLKWEIMNKDGTIDWDLLRSKNEDVVGWLKIEGTNIDTPIVQADNNDIYLYTNFKGEYDERGVPFLDMAYQWDPRSTNSLIYGHSTMRSGVPVMFDELLKYVDDLEFVKNHNLIEYRRPPELGGDGIYKIFAIIIVESDEDYRQLDFYSSDEFLMYYSRIRSMSIVSCPDVDLEPGDEIITLSTCIFNTGLKDGRLVVIGKRIK